MLGRSRMRRGVSLEVIVEEDDNADVTLDPSPLLEDDDEDDEDEEEDDSENANSAPDSPGRNGGARGKGGSGGGLSVEERRRRRERRKTVGLSRLRSVSCETLTLLDTSDMDSCWSEWDDEEDHPGGRNSSYVTLHHPISRRRILQSTNCDSEDSGIEYHSNEDEQPLDEAGPSARGRVRDDADSQSQSESNTLSDDDDDIHDQETATESDDEDGINSRIVRRADLKKGGMKDEEGRNDELVEEKEEEDGKIRENGVEGSELPRDESDAEAIRRKEEEENKKQLESFRRQGGEEEEGGRRKQDEGGSEVQGYKGKEMLENDKVVIVETTPSVPLVKLPLKQDDDKEVDVPYKIRNKEVVVEELPKPHTVSSVRRLFENPHTPLGHLTAWRTLGRFRDIKSNPSSKILRFDRNDSGDGGVSLLSGPFAYCTLPRRPKDLKPSTNLSDTQTTPRRTQALPPMPSQTKNKTDPRDQLQKVKTQGGQVIALRKPITVRGFNVKKALQEDPRTFTHVHNNNQNNNNNQPNQPNKIIQPNKTQTKTKPQTNVQPKVQNGRKNHVTFAKHKSIHHASEFGLADRSDTESLASDISEDSGVCNDSNIQHSYQHRTHVDYTKDPSFKWIDPAIMAKIRSVGTTVIFFGPRNRPHHSRSSPTPSALLPSLSTPTGGGGGPRGGPKGSASQGRDTRRSPVAAPRIVGVLRKKSPSPIPSPAK